MKMSIELFGRLVVEGSIKQFEEDKYNKYYVDKGNVIYMLKKESNVVKYYKYLLNFKVNDIDYNSIEVSEVAFQEEYMN